MGRNRIDINGAIATIHNHPVRSDIACNDSEVLWVNRTIVVIAINDISSLYVRDVQFSYGFIPKGV